MPRCVGVGNMEPRFTLGEFLMKPAIMCSVFLVCVGAMIQQADAQCGCGPTVAYYAPATTTVYYAPTTAYYATPVTTYYAPMTTYYRAPVTAYRMPVMTYYSPYTSVYRRGFFGRRTVRRAYWTW